MREIRTSGSMSGDERRSGLPPPPRSSSTLLKGGHGRRLCRSAMRKGFAFPGACPYLLHARREAQPRGVREEGVEPEARKAVEAVN